MNGRVEFTCVENLLPPHTGQVEWAKKVSSFLTSDVRTSSCLQWLSNDFGSISLNARHVAF